MVLYHVSERVREDWVVVVKFKRLDLKSIVVCQLNLCLISWERLIVKSLIRLGLFTFLHCLFKIDFAFD